jgi:hypothetical protein
MLMMLLIGLRSVPNARMKLKNTGENNGTIITTTACNVDASLA